MEIKENDDRPIVVTIRCVTYNHEPYIRQCLEGLVMQKTNFRFEAVVHDDASTDKTADIIREYAEKYPDIIKPIYETENQFSKHDGSLRRIVNAHLRGKYVALCEGDDYWIDPLKLQKQVEFLESHPEYVLVHTNFSCDRNGYVFHTNEMNKVPKIDDYSTVLLSEGNKVVTLTALFCKDALDRTPHLADGKGWMMGDYPFWIELSHEGKFKYLDDITANYRVLEQSASHSTQAERRLEFIENSREICFFYRDYYKMNISKEVIERRFYISFIKTAYDYKRKDLAIKYYHKARSRGVVTFKEWIFVILLKLRDLKISAFH